jgi:DNA-directed RNA polymerase alpha subunit
MPKRPIKPLEENNIKTVSDLLNSDEEKLIDIKGITESSLEKVYDAVQIFVEENQSQKSTENEETETDKENNPELEKVES